MAETKYTIMWKFLIESNYEDAAVIGSDMRCTICTRILINAHNSVCGCRYCLECVKAYLNGERRFCPGKTDDCNVEELDIDNNIHPDVAMNYRISKLIVSCRYSCGYQCELRKMEEHERACQRQPVDCPFANVGCRETRLVTDRINEHLVEENESHARLLMTCIDRLECKTTSMERSVKEIDEARARETNELVDQIKQEVVNLRNENKLTKEENNSLKAEMEKYRKEFLGLVAATERQLAEMQAERQTQARTLELLTEKYSRSEEKLSKLEQQTLKEKELSKNIDEMRENEASRPREIAINCEMQNQTEFMWSIEGWAAKQKSARDGTCTQIFSAPFFSHKNGYKMCLSMDPDGYSIGKGTHLCLRFSLMRGPFDNILSWPFKRDVTLSLVDQQTGIDHVSHTFKFNDYPNHVYWNKPTTENNGEFCHSQLIKQASLSSTAGLCQDDKLLIKCTVKWHDCNN